MSRSKWKNYFIHSKFFKKEILLNKRIVVWSKNSTIFKILFNKKLVVYIGRKNLKNIYITSKKNYFKIGEFCFTRAKFFHKNKKNKIKNKIKNNKNLKLKIKKKK